jgi:OFA family oxalate/formate antiporter-like MFS transporter
MKNRWLVLIAGCVIQTILGGIYAWSTFVPYFIKDHGLSSGQCGLVFGVTILTFTVAMIVAGRILVKQGPRFTALVSAGLFASGYLLAALSRGSLPLLILSLGVVAGSGIGFGYVCPLSVGMKWFPEKKGFVTGLTVAGFGAGAILLSYVADHFLVHGMDVLTFFRGFGIVAGVILFAAALFLSDPPGETSNAAKQGHMHAVFAWPFSISVIGLFAGTFGGLLIIGNLAPIILKAGLTEQQAVASVSLFAIGNGLGRIIWGRLFDHIHYRSIPFSLGGFALAALLLLLPLPYGILMFAVVLIGFCFGANFVVYASTISRFFGTDAFPHLYPICFMAYGVAGIIGPALGGFLADATGTYNTAIYICIALVSAAGVLSLVKLGTFKAK